jgi:hypothetical protein
MNTKITTSPEEIFLAASLDDVWATPDHHALERARTIADRDAIERWREKEALRQERSIP